MASSTANQIQDLNEHKRKVFFENLSPQTTKDSLEKYLSRFPIETCIIPHKEGESHHRHGIIIFRKESSVDNIMLQRPHLIDGQPVQVYRSVPGQGPLKKNKEVKSLVVSGIKNGSITKSDLQQYFSVFGTIDHIDMNYNDNYCCIEFEDYDSVDKALLHGSHPIIRHVKVHLTKGSRNKQCQIFTSPTNIQTENSNNNSMLPRKPILKQVQRDPQISSLNIPKKIYCIHITNLPSNADAEILSKKFSWTIDNIVINSPFDNQSSPIECWLKGIDEQQEAENFVQRWNGQLILRLKIACEVEEDQLELCKEFRIGKCPNKTGVCDWWHIMCTANGQCSSDCPYGHREGLKIGYFNNCSNKTYRIKITGFRKKLKSESLTQILHEKNCYVDQHQDRVVYIAQVRTMRYAQRLIAKWRNKEIDGQKLQCQIELDPRSSMSKTLYRSGSMSNLKARENDSPRLDRSCQRLNNSANTSRDISISRENSDPQITTLDDQDFNNEARSFDRSVEDIKQKATEAKRKSKSAEIVSLSVHPKSQISNETAENSRKMSLIRKETDHGSLAVLVEYKNTDEEIYYRELNALKLLKDVKGVVQLIELEDSPDTDDQQLSSKSNLSLITEHPPGYSLKEFINRIHRGGFGVLEAIQLVQNLITIVKQVHYKGVLHQNLEPENIIIELDSKQTSIDQARLILINFSQAYIKSDKNNRTIQSAAQCWYKAPQLNVESLKYSPTIDASSICAILFWLLTNTDPRHDHNLLPHQQENAMDKLDNKITQAVRNANANKKQLLEEKQLKTYLIDTFNIGFGYPQHEPWTIGGLECRLESIHELLSSRNPKPHTTDAIFKELISTYNTTVPVSTVTTNTDQDIFQKASIAFQQAKTNFSKFMNDQYSWSDGSCTWLDSAQTSTNERRHDDIFTYYCRDRHMQSSCSIIITCLATLTDEGNGITLSIGSVVNGKMCRIPIGHYSTTQNYIGEFQKYFLTELNNLIVSIAKERRAILQ